jgi:hypothetical protein
MNVEVHSGRVDVRATGTHIDDSSNVVPLRVGYMEHLQAGRLLSDDLLPPYASVR